MRSTHAYLALAAAALLSGCAELGGARAVPGMPGVTVRRAPEEPAAPVLAMSREVVVNRYGRLITVYYADGRMQHVMPGEAYATIEGLAYTVQVRDPKRIGR